MTTILTSSITPDAAEYIKNYLLEALNYYPTFETEEFIRQHPDGVTIGELVATVRNAMAAQADLIHSFEATIDETSIALSEWSEAWDVSEAAIDDLNARLAGGEVICIPSSTIEAFEAAQAKAEVDVTA